MQIQGREHPRKDRLSTFNNRTGYTLITPVHGLRNCRVRKIAPGLTSYFLNVGEEKILEALI